MKKYLWFLLPLGLILLAFYLKPKADYYTNDIKISGTVSGKLEGSKRSGKYSTESKYHTFIIDDSCHIEFDIIVTPLTYYRSIEGQKMTFYISRKELGEYSKWPILQALSWLAAIISFIMIPISWGLNKAFSDSNF
jgi:hypothetical protein